MKICIITLHCIPNFGSYFQALCLQSYLASKNHDVEIIDYQPDFVRSCTIREYVGRLLYRREYVKQGNEFRYAREKYLKTTEKKYYRYEQLANDPPSADLYISGGDQLWNHFYSCGRDLAYKLKFVNGNKMSYGTSMGHSLYTEDQLRQLASEISDYKYISVRESSSAYALKSVGIDSAKHVVDPVALHEMSYYDQFTERPVDYEYIFVYLVRSSKLLDVIVRYLSTELNVRVVVCAGFQQKCVGDIVLRSAGPNEILSYIRHARFVVSGSFHASMFSIMFNRAFVTILPGMHTNERIVDLLGWCGLNGRVIYDDSNIKGILDEIDYGTVNTLLCHKTCESREWLDRAINEIASER